jgi:hypothetical protein
MLRHDDLTAPPGGEHHSFVSVSRRYSIRPAARLHGFGVRLVISSAIYHFSGEHRCWNYSF